MKRIAFLFLSLLFFETSFSQGTSDDTTSYLSGVDWDSPSEWYFSKQDGMVTGSLSAYPGLNGDGIELSWNFPSGGGWVNSEHNLTAWSANLPIVLFLYSTAGINVVELKFTDSDGSVFGVRLGLENFYGKWNHIRVYLDDTEYWWGGNRSFDFPSKFSVALSGSLEGEGSVFMDEIGIGKPGLPSTILSTIDPDYALPGTGFLQRRDTAMLAEDPLVLEYIKELQDYSSPAHSLLSSYKGGAEAQTFNNSLGALAFIIKNEKERAERILDFYQDATDSLNTVKQKQNFFYNGEARGFYQQAVISSGLDVSSSDRWIGDMAWLLIACKNYEYKFSSDRYEYLVRLIKDLFISYYIDAGTGGYIRSGWRKGDSYLHENTGHHEGNIDCYVALKLCGEDYYAHKIKLWLDKELEGLKSLPLDLYTWRCLAFGALDDSYIALLNIPEYDFRYRKIISVNGTDVMGMYSFPDILIQNFWNDGTGHISCAFQAFGDIQRGYFYANQMDPLIISQDFNGKLVHGIPYTLNNDGYPGVDVNIPVISCAAWYILAKNGCNPFLSENFTDIAGSNTENLFSDLAIPWIYPNPFSESLTINFTLRKAASLNIEIYSIGGSRVCFLEGLFFPEGSHSIPWKGETENGSKVNQGIYIVKISGDGFSRTAKIIFMP